MMKTLLVFFLVLFSCCVHAKTLNVYAWGGTFPASVLQKFEKETGIHVNFSEYDSNETLYAKLKAAPHSEYDVIVPSSYYIEKMRHEKMLRPLDSSTISNKKNIMPFFLNRDYDPHNRYDIPFIWGATGIVINAKYFNPKSIHSLSQLWEPRFHNQLLMLDDVREAFSIALIRLHLSPNTKSVEAIRLAYYQLRDLLPNIRVFNSSSPFIVYSDDDIHAGIGWNGDIYKATLTNPDIHYIFPRDGFVISVDCLAIPRYAPHPKAALQFINFTQRGTINSAIVEYYKNPSTNRKGMKLLPKTMRNNKTFNPPTRILKRGILQKDVGDSLAFYMHYWAKLKLEG